MRVISKVLWGTFCFETRISYFYSQRALLPPPSIPKHFDESYEASCRIQHNADASSEYADTRIWTPVQILGITDALCDLSEIFYKVMTLNTEEEESGDDADEDVDGQDKSAKRVVLYNRVNKWMEDLPLSFKPDSNFAYQSCFLRIFVNETILCIFKGQPSDWIVPGGDVAVKEIIIRNCRIDTDLIEQYMRKYPCIEFLTRGLYVSATALIPYLDDPRTHQMYTRDVLMLSLCIPHMRIALVLLQGIQALTWALKKTIPKAAKPYFEGCGPAQDSKDVPTGFAMPHQDQIMELLSNDENDETQWLGDQLGSLIARWSSLSII